MTRINEFNFPDKNPIKNQVSNKPEQKSKMNTVFDSVKPIDLPDDKELYPYLSKENIEFYERIGLETGVPVDLSLMNMKAMEGEIIKSTNNEINKIVKPLPSPEIDLLKSTNNEINEIVKPLPLPEIDLLKSTNNEINEVVMPLPLPEIKE